MNMARLGFVMLVGLATATMAAAQQSSQAQAPAQSSSQTAQSNTSSSPESSLAAAARRAREERKQQPAAKTPRVWDNDNIPTIPSNLNVVGSADSDSNAQPADQAAAPAATPVDKDAIGKDLAAAKDHLQSLQTDLDLLQRTYTLDQQSYYGKPDYSSDPDGAAKLKGEQTAIDAKQQEIEDAQKKIGDLQAQFNSASAAKPATNNSATSGGGSSDTNPPANPPPASN